MHLHDFPADTAEHGATDTWEILAAEYETLMHRAPGGTAAASAAHGRALAARRARLAEAVSGATPSAAMLRLLLASGDAELLDRAAAAFGAEALIALAPTADGAVAGAPFCLDTVAFLQRLHALGFDLTPWASHILAAAVARDAPEMLDFALDTAGGAAAIPERPAFIEFCGPACAARLLALLRERRATGAGRRPSALIDAVCGYYFKTALVLCMLGEDPRALLPPAGTARVRQRPGQPRTVAPVALAEFLQHFASAHGRMRMAAREPSLAAVLARPPAARFAGWTLGELALGYRRADASPLPARRGGP